MNKTVYVNANIYDGTEDMKLFSNFSIEVEDGKITRVDRFVPNNKECKIIDLEGKFVTPGLVNLHSHLPSNGKLSKGKLGDKSKLVKFIISNPITRKVGFILCKNSAKQALNAGITTVRTVGGIIDLDSKLRDKINCGKILGPRLIVCNGAIGVKGGHMDGTVSNSVANEKEAIDMVDMLIEQKVDAIKLMITGGVLDGKEAGHPGTLKMDPKIIKVCCDEAHKHGLKVLAHVESPEGMKAAIENGVDSIEHSSYFDDSDAEILKERNGAVVLTLTPALPFIKIDPEIVGYGEIAKINSEIIYKGMLNSFKQARKHNILVGLGNDAGSTLVTHYNFANEVVMAARELKISNKEALHIATEANATIAGVSNVTGTLEVGKDADFIVLDKDPIEDLHNLKYPKMVVIKGHLIKKPKVKFDKVADNLLNPIY